MSPTRDQVVAARTPRSGVIEVPAHLPEVQFCGQCDTVHPSPVCPSCRQRIDATDEPISGMVFGDRLITIPAPVTR